MVGLPTKTKQAWFSTIDELNDGSRKRARIRGITRINKIITKLESARTVLIKSGVK